MGNWKPIVVMLVTCAVLISGLSFWLDNKAPQQALLLDSEGGEINAPLSPEELKVVKAPITNDMNPQAILKTNKGTITLELFEDQMPVTVGNFTKLADEGFYNNTKFHRIINNFMIQAGDPNTKPAPVLTYGTGGNG